jgi:hypothetical protein
MVAPSIPPIEGAPQDASLATRRPKVSDPRLYLLEIARMCAVASVAEDEREIFLALAVLRHIGQSLPVLDRRTA